MFVSMRCEKVSKVGLGSIQGHNIRTSHYNGKNISHTRTGQNLTVVGSKTIDQDVQDRLNGLLNGKTVRKDAVVALEFVFSASPGYFYDDLDLDKFNLMTMEKNKAELDEIYKTKLNRRKLDDFVKTIDDFCKKEFGENVINLTLHLDEKTPHLHLISTPITPDGRLCAKEIFTPENARIWQDKIGEAVKPLGLQRGIKNSEKQYTSSRDHNEMLVKSAMPEIPNFKANRPDPLPEKDLGIFGKSKKEIFEHGQKREEALKAEVKFYKEQTKKYQVEAIKGKIAIKESNDLKKSNNAFKASNSLLKSTLKEFGLDDTAKLKDDEKNEIKRSLKRTWIEINRQREEKRIAIAKEQEAMRLLKEEKERQEKSKKIEEAKKLSDELKKSLEERSNNTNNKLKLKFA